MALTRSVIWHINTKMRFPTFMKLRMATYMSCLVTLIWMASLIYFLLGLVLNSHFRRHRILPGMAIDAVAFDLLKDIGFTDNPKLYPQSYHDEDVPVFVMALESAQYRDFFLFLRSMKQYYPNKKFVIYNVDLSQEQLRIIHINCFCVVRDIHWDRYPYHVRYTKYRAFVPLLIQESLDEFGAVFWMEPTMRFTSSDLWVVGSYAAVQGLVSWPLLYPTSSFTHYNMFRYFNTSHDAFYFHRMIDPSRTVYYNTATLHKEVMLPWVMCALDIDCIAPVGSQPAGCNFQRKPKYIYAGCHHYDMSALNVILAKAFDFQTPYITSKLLFKIAFTKSGFDLKSFAEYLPMFVHR